MRLVPGLFQHRGACPPSATYLEGATALPDLAWGSLGHSAIDSLLRTSGPVQGTRSSGTTWSIAYHCHFSKNFPWEGSQPLLVLWKYFQVANNVWHKWVLFLPFISCWGQSPLCWIGSIRQKTNFQSESKNTESSVLHLFYVKCPLFKMTITKFLNLTTASPCNSQNHTAMTIPCLFISPSWLLIPTDPQATIHSFLTIIVMVTYTLPSLCFFSINLAHTPVYEVALAASMFYFWPCWEGAGGGLWSTVYKARSSGQWCHRPSCSLPTHSLTHPENFQSCKFNSL